MHGHLKSSAAMDLAQRQQSGGERRGSLIRPSLLVDCELKVGKTRQTFNHAYFTEILHFRRGRDRRYDRRSSHPVRGNGEHGCAR
jgi:hypothetical protein